MNTDETLTGWLFLLALTFLFADKSDLPNPKRLLELPNRQKMVVSALSVLTVIFVAVLACM